MKTHNFRIIGFDLDQTLYPKSPQIDRAIQDYIYKKIAQANTVDEETAKRQFTELYQNGKGLSGSQTLIHLGFPLEEAKNVVQEALEHADIAKFLEPNPAVLALLTKLKFHYQSMDLITGSGRAIAQKKLMALGLAESLFDHWITGDEGSKSDLSSYKQWLAYYPTYKPETFLYIGDRVSSDYEKPKELGIESILVNIIDPDSSLPCLQLPSLLSIEPYLL